MKKVISKLLKGGKIKKINVHDDGTFAGAYKSNNGNFLIFFSDDACPDEMEFCLRIHNECEDFKHYSFRLEPIGTKIAIVGHYLVNKAAVKK